MFLLEPQRTPWDLSFSVLGFPVRVHPLFWLMSLLMGGVQDPKQMVIVVLVFFVSILIHELGHALMIRRFGREAHIVLYGMGGLAIEGSTNPYSTHYHPRGERRTPKEQIYISLAGPVAQFILAGLAIVFVKGMGGEVAQSWRYNPIPSFDVIEGPRINAELALMLDVLIQINIWWAFMNLLPVFPLDGGQIAMQLFTMRDPHGGMVRGLQLSIAVGIGVAILSLTMMGRSGWFTALLFGSLAFSNYMTYMQIHSQGGNRW